MFGLREHRSLRPSTSKGSLRRGREWAGGAGGAGGAGKVRRRRRRRGRPRRVPSAPFVDVGVGELSHLFAHQLPIGARMHGVHLQQREEREERGEVRSEVSSQNTACSSPPQFAPPPRTTRLFFEMCCVHNPRSACDRNSQPSWTTSQPQWIGVTCSGRSGGVRRGPCAARLRRPLCPRSPKASPSGTARYGRKSQTTSPPPSPSTAACRWG